MGDKRIFYVETLQNGDRPHEWFTNGSSFVPQPDHWGRFSGDIEGEEAANKHLELVRNEAIRLGVDPSRVRLHAMTEEEIKVKLITEHRAAFDAYLRAKPLEEIRAIVAEDEKRRAPKFKPWR